MSLWSFFRRSAPPAPEVREIASSSPNILEVFGLANASSAGEHVTIDSALGVPACWSAVNFLAGTMAGLPVHVYRRQEDGRERVRSPLATLLHDAVNDEMSSFEWRKWFFEQVFTGGRAFTHIDRNARGQVINLWPMDPQHVTVVRRDGAKTYKYREHGRETTFEAREVLDLPFMLKSDGLQHRSPILANREAIGLAQSVTKHGGKYFSNGGVPPFAITGGFESGDAMRRAMDDLDAAVRKASKENRQALALPRGLEINPLGSAADDMQMIETQRFCIEQIARIYSLPPTFLQDLTHGTFSNTEQQDLHFVKHTIKRWVEQFEQELNLKLFGRSRNTVYVQINLDGLLRGDFKTRMEGYARAIQAGIMMPSESRQKENLPFAEGSDQLFIQGATVPIDQAGQVMPGATGADDTGDDDDAEPET